MCTSLSYISDELEMRNHMQLTKSRKHRFRTESPAFSAFCNREISAVSVAGTCEGKKQWQDFSVTA